MKKQAAIITIGTELISGVIVNTHAQYLSLQLMALGYHIRYHLSCADDPKAIDDSLKFARQDCQLIVTTGGLGPTVDDITRQCVANFLSLPLVKNEVAEQKLIELFKTHGYQMTDNNYRQAYFPETATVLQNQKGSADGFMVRRADIAIVALPGPRAEMKHVYTDILKPQLLGSLRQYNREIKLFGIGESSVDQLVADYLISDDTITAGIYASDGIITLRFSTSDHSKARAMAKLNPRVEGVVSRLGEHVFSTDSKSLEATLVAKLIQRNMTISFAESCTGGLLAKNITDIAGASDVFNASFVTYSNSEKMRLLDVSSDTLERYGAVSEPTASEMASGLYQLTKADICIAITGITGPTGGSADKPIGLVYIALAKRGVVTVKQLNLRGDRQRVRRHTALNAYQWALQSID